MNPLFTTYDFSILPYSLGDVLTWNVKQCVKAFNEDRDSIVASIICDAPTNKHQEQYIAKYNCKSYMADLLPAFYTNPMLSNINVVHDASALQRSIPTEWIPINEILFKEISSHEDINEHFKKTGIKPRLLAPVGFGTIDRAVNEQESVIVAVHLRSRMTDQSIGVTESHRDADLNVWLQFFDIVSKEYPDVYFVSLGRLKEKSEKLFNLPNVFYPRKRGWTLAQELALITKCNLFMGTCSGFAAMAIFTDTPYLITKLDERSCKNYGIEVGDKHLPFACEEQCLCHGAESVDMLMSYFKMMMEKI